MKLRIKDFKNKIQGNLRTINIFLSSEEYARYTCYLLFLQSCYELVEYLKTFKSSKRVWKVKTS